MPTDVDAILKLSRQIATLSKEFEDGKTPQKPVQDALIAHNAAVRSVLSMGVLDEVPLDGSAISAEDLASRLNINPELVDRVLRACASTHFFTSPKTSTYAHSALSRVYLSPDNRALSAQMYDFTGQGVLAIPAFGESNGWKTAGDYYHGPFQLALSTDLGYWEYLAAHPERMKSFNTGMRVGKIGRRANAFPFGDVLELDPCKEDEVAIVDVGGGRGQSLETIREDWPLLKGRFVLQDLPGVIKDAEAKGVPEFIETCPLSFFDKQPVSGARIYYFRRIFHCWTNEKSRQILVNTKEAMNEYSRVLIADMVLPDINCPRDLAMQDLNMMSLGGMERSESDWRRLLESAGLSMRKVWLNEDGPKHAVVEAVLPGFKGHHL
ncbi:O-methyltransferase [Lasiodiplodia theobromae]|uniref:O-methyltransferase n=1 Tax=Lasiodiplodia theobromae TaxID=45133 RepID=UPI0015C2D94A|nr:O-methyltransferase [Lasiodiplodia theobromae]KAF4536159.1 O-methyltransferase [Lasiodiplodia theobromae]